MPLKDGVAAPWRVWATVLVVSTGALLVLGGLTKSLLLSRRYAALSVILGVQLLVGVLAMWAAPRRGVWGKRPSHWKLALCSLFLVGLTAIVALVLSTLVGAIGLERAHLDLAGASSLALLAILIVGSLSEELVYRGAALFGSLTFCGPHASVAISSAGFAVAHFPSGTAAAVVSLGIGLLWGYAAVGANTIVLPIMTHVLWNSLAYLGWVFG